MLHRGPQNLLLFCLLSLLGASCGSPARKVETRPESAIDGVTSDVHERAAAYAERMRLGLGSPYRLIEIALKDERLGDSNVAVAASLFAQIEQGALYEVNPRAFVAAGVHESSAIAQLDLIEQAIESAADARTGELAVVLAYELAAAEGVVTQAQVSRAARVAALVRDRKLARSDAQHLRDAARRERQTPESMIPGWREQRRFAVEQPTLASLGASAQDDAARLALLLVGGLRSAATPVNSALKRTIAPETQAITPEAARALLERDVAIDQSGIVITLRSLRNAASLQFSRLNDKGWQTFFDRAKDEESFVAALALAQQHAGDDVIAAGIALDAAIALRPFAQERIGGAAFTLQELYTRFGVRVRFDSSVTGAQRERALFVLSSALRDMRDVVRSFDVSGLTFDIAPIGATAQHLAFHDPLRRVIRLDPTTMAGTLAHEIAHDLDWQLASRKYRTRSSYATDFATQNRRALAYAVENLAGDAAHMMKDNVDAAARRPAEIFARRFEWYMASALAMRGRSNAYLSSAQNDWIRGYGSAVRPDASRAAAQSFAALLAEATNMDRSALADAERTVIESAPVIVRVLLRANAASNGMQLRAQSFAELRDWECSSGWPAGQSKKAGIQWFVDALSAAASKPVAQPDGVQAADYATIEPVRATEPGNQLSVRLTSCDPLRGVVFAGSVR